MRECVRAAGHPLPGLIVPPGVDTDRFRPLSEAERVAARHRFALDVDRPLVLGLSRLVPRKGFDVLITAMAGIRRNAQLAIAGAGRDRERLRRIAKKAGVQVELLGRVDDADLPALYGCADVFAMPCRADRWGGIEAEGFGIVYLEAAACGVPADRRPQRRRPRGRQRRRDRLRGRAPVCPALRNALVRLLDDVGPPPPHGDAARAGPSSISATTISCTDSNPSPPASSARSPIRASERR